MVAGITPFNFHRGTIPMWMFGIAIAVGNSFILKPSEKDPSLPLRLAELMMEAGAPAGVLNVIHGDKSAVDAILAHPLIRAVSFVGSSDIAHYVYSTGTANGKRASKHAQLKNHGVVLPDADLDQVVKDISGAAFGSAGERCMALPVVVPVGAKTAEALRERMVAEMETLKIGVSTDADAHYGPVVSAAHRQKIADYIQIGRDEGAELVVDGRGFALQGYEKGFFIGPSLFDHVKPTMKTYQEEIFGPGPANGPRRVNFGGFLTLPSATPIRQRRRHLHPQRPGRAGVRRKGQCRHGRRQRAHSGARRLSHLRRLEAQRLWRHQPTRRRGGEILHQGQDGDRALAGGRYRGLGLRHPDDAMNEAVAGEPDVLVRREAAIGRLSLNRPTALHALTQDMCTAMTAALLSWRRDPSVGFVVIDHTGERGFCAGGDIRMLAESGATDGRAARAFFLHEYRLNHLLFAYDKPVVAIMDGVTMGGGVGLSAPARYRIATERTIWSMPETGIGLFPDVGGGQTPPWRRAGAAPPWPRRARLKAADCMALGLATRGAGSPRAARSRRSKRRCRPHPGPATPMRRSSRRSPTSPRIRGLRQSSVNGWISIDCSPDPSVEAIFNALAGDGGDWAEAQLSVLTAKSPQTLKVAFRQLDIGAGLTEFADEMAMEYRISARVVQRPDFIEGVRA